MTDIQVGSKVKVIGVELPEWMDHLMGKVVTISQIKSEMDSYEGRIYKINDPRPTSDSTWVFSADELELISDDTDETIWEIRIDGGNVHNVKGADNVLVFVNGVRAVKPDAVIERRVWERF